MTKQLWIILVVVGLVGCASPAPPATTVRPDAPLPTATATLSPSPEPSQTPSPSPSPNPTATPFITPPPAGRPAAIPILMYHHITDLAPTESALEHDWTVAPGNLDAQMSWLVEHGFHTISLAQLAAFFTGSQPLPQKPLVLTFDDGWEDDYSTAFPILKKHNYTATFFVYTSPLDHKQFLSWSQLAEMVKAGMEIGSHTLTHPHLKDLSTEEAKKEIQDSKATLEKRLGIPITTFAYPFGDYTSAIVDQVKQAGYETAVSISGGYNQSSNQLFLLHRIRVSYKDTLPDFASRLP